MIESYDFGRILIDGIVYTSYVIIMGEKVAAGWWRNKGHLLQVSDISDAVEEFAPEVAVVGTGYSEMMDVPRETKQYFENKGIELVAEKTRKASELFNTLSKSKRTLGALHLTC